MLAQERRTCDAAPLTGDALTDARNTMAAKTMTDHVIGAYEDETA